MKTRLRFNIPLLYETVHDDETSRIFEGIEKHKQSEFVRNAILYTAEQLGFQAPKGKPNYMPVSKWKEVKLSQMKMRKFRDQNRRIDYTYVIAFYWLRTQAEFSYLQKSEAIRKIIKLYAETEPLPVMPIFY